MGALGSSSRSTAVAAADDLLLLARDRANCPGFVPVSGKKSGRFGHPVIVGAMALPVLPRFAKLSALRPPFPR
jgi:hypothetical protein